MEQGGIKCLICGQILSGEGELPCPCGLKYTYHAYRRSYRENNMPRGAASPVFDRFISQWERVSIDRSLQTAHGGAQEKMRLIDRLIQGTKNADNGAFAGAGPMKIPGVSHVCKYPAFKKEQVWFTLKLNQTCPFFTI